MANGSIPGEHAATTTIIINTKWDEERMHGQLQHSLDEKLVTKNSPYWWLKFGDIKEETKYNHGNSRSGRQYKLLQEQNCERRNWW